MTFTHHYNVQIEYQNNLRIVIGKLLKGRGEAVDAIELETLSSHTNHQNFISRYIFLASTRMHMAKFYSTENSLNTYPEDNLLQALVSSSVGFVKDYRHSNNLDSYPPYYADFAKQIEVGENADQTELTIFCGNSLYKIMYLVLTRSTNTSYSSSELVAVQQILDTRAVLSCLKSELISKWFEDFATSNKTPISPVQLKAKRILSELVQKYSDTYAVLDRPTQNQIVGDGSPNSFIDLEREQLLSTRPTQTKKIGFPISTLKDSGQELPSKPATKAMMARRSGISSEEQIRLDGSQTDLDILQKKLDNNECARIPITPNYSIFAERSDGSVLGPIGEGTTAIVLFARRSGDPQSLGTDAPNFAIRIPRMSTGSRIQNFENAETCYLEHIQSTTLNGRAALHSPVELGCFHNIVATDSGDELGLDISKDKGQISIIPVFRMGPGLSLKIGLISDKFIWPESLELALRNRGESPSDIFASVSELLRKNRAIARGAANSGGVGKEFQMPPVYLAEDVPTITNEKRRSERAGTISLDRQAVENFYVNESASGWFIGLPYMVSDWLSADLQRSLVGVVTRTSVQHTQGKDRRLLPIWQQLRDLPLHGWLQMCSRLCDGLSAIHLTNPTEDFANAHGDVRPANVMFVRNHEPRECKWIDIGLGSLLARERRLGFSLRRSIFYSWEKLTHESEENDFAQMNTFDDAEGKKRFSISLMFRDSNLSPAQAIRLRQSTNGTSGRLSLLKRGDRLVVGGEFVFRIDEVRDSELIVDKSWKIYSNQFLVESSIAEIFSKRGHKPMADFKVLWRWGIASDIYGFGVLLLYVFYMRGRYGELTSRNLEDFQGASVVDVEDEFSNLVGAIRNQGFLSAFFRSLAGSSIPDSSGKTDPSFNAKSDLLGLSDNIMLHTRPSSGGNLTGSKDLTENEKDIINRLQEVVDELSIHAPGLQTVFYGLNSNPALFSAFLYVVLACLWRKDEVERIGLIGGLLDSRVVFSPYCTSRLRDDTEGSIPTVDLHRDLQILERHLSSKPESSGKFDQAQPLVEPGEYRSMHRGGTIHSTLQEQNSRIGELEKIVKSIADLSKSAPSKNNVGFGFLKFGFWKLGSNSQNSELLRKIEEIVITTQISGKN
ncbi:protein kinase family protein [Cypionkella psychrotolerans]|uniref:hypothetical protein n=1 Tax=Cypionkella psychrotolerans TaxID=1678131 RepID=UPI0012E0EDE3|nr:hypothetical protein [Cypionkella psychrotolerans]